MDTLQFEPMSVGRIFDRTFAIYRNNFLRFITIAAIIEVPLALLSTAYTSWARVEVPPRQKSTFKQAAASQDTAPTTRRRDRVDEQPILACCLLLTLTLLPQIFVGMLCQAALCKSVSETYLGNDITVGQAYGFILSKSLTLIGATLCTAFVIGLGYMLLIVPGVIFSLWFGFTVPVIVLENRSVTDAMSRSKALVAGNLGKALAIGFVATLIANLVFQPLRYCGGSVARVLAPDNAMLELALKNFGGLVGSVLTGPISGAAAILLYYDLRIRKEGFDLQMLAQSMSSEQGKLRAG